MGATIVFLKLAGLCTGLNIVRYVIIGFVEQLVIFDGLFGAMEQSSSYFATSFETIDWITSYAYNYAMWFIALIVFHLLHPRIPGTMVVRSLAVFALILGLFLSISAIYMNHYSHPKDFYLWNMADAVLVFPLVGLANGLMYPLFFRGSADTPAV